MGSWLRHYSGALAAFASIVLVAVTIVYVRLTAKLTEDSRSQVREMIKSRLDAQMPYVAISASGFHITGSASVQIDAALWNMGHTPAQVYIDYPENWEYTWQFRGEADPGTLYLTLNAGDRHEVQFSAEIDPSAPLITDHPRMHLQHLGLEFHVSPLAVGAKDLFTWSTYYDSSTDSLMENTELAFFDHRTYYELDSERKKKKK